MSPDRPTERRTAAIQAETLQETFARLDPLALAIALGIAGGVIACLGVLGASLSEDILLQDLVGLLGDIFPMVSATGRGALAAFGYGLLAGGTFGYGFAAIRNFVVRVVLAALKFTSYARALIEDPKG